MSKHRYDKSKKKIIIAISILAVIAILVYGASTMDFARLFGEESALLPIQEFIRFI